MKFGSWTLGLDPSCSNLFFFLQQKSSAALHVEAVYSRMPGSGLRRLQSQVQGKKSQRTCVRTGIYEGTLLRIPTTAG